jgi:hypothetical protein
VAEFVVQLGRFNESGRLAAFIDTFRHRLGELSIAKLEIVLR